MLGGVSDLPPGYKHRRHHFHGAVSQTACILAASESVGRLHGRVKYDTICCGGGTHVQTANGLKHVVWSVR